jgi:hypothetical protein
VILDIEILLILALYYGIVLLKKSMKSPLTRSLRKQTPISKKAIPYVTAEKLYLHI